MKAISSTRRSLKVSFSAIFDSYLPIYRQNQNDFDAGMKVGVVVDGTVEKRDDADKGWTVEMAIPLDSVKGKEKEMKNVPPSIGTTWKVNFFRMDMPGGKSQQGTSWSPPLVGDFHALDKFGFLVFGDEKGGVLPPLQMQPQAPATDAAKAGAKPASTDKGAAKKAAPESKDAAKK